MKYSCCACGASGLSSDTDTSDRCPACEEKHDEELAQEASGDDYFDRVDEQILEMKDGGLL